MVPTESGIAGACYEEIAMSPPVSNNGAAGGTEKGAAMKANTKCIIALTVTVAVLVLVVMAACVGFAVEIAKLKSDQELSQLSSVDQLDNITLQITLSTHH